MRSRQSGVTLIGWIILLIPFVIVFYAGLRLAPVYLNYIKVVRSLDEIKTELHGTDNLATVRYGLVKHLQANSVDYPDIKDIKFTRSSNGGWLVQAAYDDQAPLFANVFILVSFDKSVTLGRGGGGE